MRRVSVALALAALLPAAARAEPITVSVESSSGGFTQTGSSAGSGLDFGAIVMPAGAEGMLKVGGLDTWVDYTVSFTLVGTTEFNNLRAEILDFSGFDDWADPPQPSWMPPGLTTSHDWDGFSFAQDSPLERSAVFAGGNARVTADEKTHRGDILLFSGLQGAEDARVTFGLRDSVGDRSFLVRLTADGVASVGSPEPASMLLIGTGLAGMAGVYRRRRRERHESTVAD
jgi:hypothetical protein